MTQTRRNLAIVVLLALGLRLVLWAQPLHQPANDEVEYITVARDLLAQVGIQRGYVMAQPGSTAHHDGCQRADMAGQRGLHLGQHGGVPVRGHVAGAAHATAGADAPRRPGVAMQCSACACSRSRRNALSRRVVAGHGQRVHRFVRHGGRRRRAGWLRQALRQSQRHGLAKGRCMRPAFGRVLGQRTGHGSIEPCTAARALGR